MIPASWFLLDGDTALWVLPGLPTTDELEARPDPPETLFLNRLCDWCEGFIDPDDELALCDCDGTGCHTFDIEVTYTHREMGCTRGEVEEVGGIWPHHTFRVHVIDVLPIVEHDDWVASGQPEAIARVDSERWMLRRGNGTCDWITLPPDAAPGMWLVRLAVHQ